MRLLNPQECRAFLERYGMPSKARIDEVLGGFDFSKPVYEQLLSQDEVLYQYIRNASLGDLSPSRGGWFCLPGAGTSGLAITDGIAGRRLHKFRVLVSTVALEGAAAAKDIDWRWAGGGVGGSTQIYVPPFQLGHIGAVAPQSRW